MLCNQPATRKGLNCLAALCLLGFLLAGCDYARMKDDEAVHTYETAVPEMPAHTIPIRGGVEVLRMKAPGQLQNPLPSTPQNLARGRLTYTWYCVHCHGPKADGNGTVGQSFAPLPTNLHDAGVQKQSDGELFHKIAFGFKRHPPMYYTVGAPDTWAIIDYLRSIGSRPRS